MRTTILSALIVLALAPGARADDLITAKSTKPVKETLDRLQKAVTENGFFVVARVPHSDAAKGAGLELRPTELLIFGKPQSGTPVMVCDQRAGIDLPLRAVAWRDRDGQTWLAMVDPRVLKQRYALAAECDAVLGDMETTVRGFIKAATQS